MPSPISTTTTSTTNATVPQSYEAAFDATREERAALDPAELKVVYTDVMTAASRARSAGQRAAKYDARLAALQEIIPALREKLIRHADAAAGAHIRLVNANEKPPVVIPMIDELRRERDMLANDVKALVSRGLVPQKRLDGLNMTTGFRAIAYDVMILAGGILQEWATVQGRTGATREELEKLRGMAQAADEAVSLREDQERERDDAADQRQRAFTLLDATHDEMERAMTFLLWREGPEAIAAAIPPLQSGRPRKSKSTDEDEVAPEPAANAAGTAPVAGAGDAPKGSTNGAANGAAAPSPKLNPFVDG